MELTLEQYSLTVKRYLDAEYPAVKQAFRDHKRDEDIRYATTRQLFSSFMQCHTIQHCASEIAALVRKRY